MTRPIDHQMIAGTLRLIEDEQRWAKGAIARTIEGDACAWNDPRAVRFCAAGALVRVAADLLGDEARARQFAVKVG